MNEIETPGYRLGHTHSAGRVGGRIDKLQSRNCATWQTPSGPYTCIYVGCSDGSSGKSCGYDLLAEQNLKMPSLRPKASCALLGTGLVTPRKMTTTKLIGQAGPLPVSDFDEKGL